MLLLFMSINTFYFKNFLPVFKKISLACKEKTPMTMRVILNGEHAMNCNLALA